MKKKYFKIICFLLLVTANFACRKVIDIPVSDSTPKLIIDAFYDATKQEVKVKISETKTVFTADTSFQGIVGAIIEIRVENGNTATLNDLGGGIYTLENYAPVFNRPYTMRVLLDDIVYTATDSLPNIVPFDSLTAEFQEGSIFFEEGYLLTINFLDPKGPNFYRLFQNVNGTPLNELGEQALFTEGFTDGQPYELPIYWKTFLEGDTVQLKLASYSQKSYRYYAQLFDILGGTDFMAAPANPSSFWHSNSENAMECLGHFTTYGYSTDSIIIGH